MAPAIHEEGAFRIEIYFVDHGLPHVHVITAHANAKVEIDNLAVVAGAMRPAVRRRVFRWIGDDREFCHAKWREFGGA